MQKPGTDRAKKAWETRRANAAARAAQPQGSGVLDAFGNEAPAARPPVRAAAPASKPVRAPTRAPLRSGQVLSRDGKEVLSRQRLGGNDMPDNEFELPDHLRAPGYTYRGVCKSVFGKNFDQNYNSAYAQGWRPVTAGMFGNHFAGRAAHEHVERDGLILCERPNELEAQALDELHEEAQELKNVTSQTFGGRPLPDGFKKGYRARSRTGGEFDASDKIERGGYYKAPKALKPKYEYAAPGEE